jgi:hypothetical protein
MLLLPCLRWIYPPSVPLKKFRPAQFWWSGPGWRCRWTLRGFQGKETFDSEPLDTWNRERLSRDVVCWNVLLKQLFSTLSPLRDCCYNIFKIMLLWKNLDRNAVFQELFPAVVIITSTSALWSRFPAIFMNSLWKNWQFALKCNYHFSA